MKQYFTGFFTGACLVASAVMFMGASESGEVGRYQISITSGGIKSNKIIYEAIIDTKLGQVERETYDWNAYY